MKKIPIPLIAIIFITCMISNVVAGDDYSINSNLEINGNCTIDRELLAQTEYGYNGQRFTETMYSRWLAISGLTETSYKSSLNIYKGASETQKDTNTSEIKYRQTTFTTNTYQKIRGQNYDAGTMIGFKTVGRSGKAFELKMQPNKNYLELEGGIEGKAILNHMVVDPISRMKIMKEKTHLEGIFNIAWSEEDEKLLCNGDTCDWLGCP